MKESDGFLTSRMAAERLGVSLRTVQLWVERGALRAWKTAGGHRRIVKDSVEEMLKKRQEAVDNPPVARRLTVVIVEDEPVTRQLYEMEFAAWALPLDVITASNGFEGLLEIGRYQPELVITDLSMPGMDGFQMIRSIQANRTTGHVSIVVVTALGESEIMKSGGLPSNIPVLQKPLQFDDLKSLLLSRLHISLR